MTLKPLCAILTDTVREARARRIFLAAALAATLCAGLMLWRFQTVTRRAPHSTLTVLSQSDPRFLDPAFLARDVLASAASMALWTQVAVAIALLAGLLGPLMSAERNALVIAAPVSRPLLLVGRYLGLLAIALWGIGITFVETWLALCWKFGVWHWRFFSGVGATLLAVAGVLALLVLLQTAFDSAAVSIVLMSAISLLGVGASNPSLVSDVTGSPRLGDLAVLLGAILPRSTEIAKWSAIYINSGVIGDSAPLWFTALGAAAFVTLAGALYARREF